MITHFRRLTRTGAKRFTRMWWRSSTSWSRCRISQSTGTRLLSLSVTWMIRKLSARSFRRPFTTERTVRSGTSTFWNRFRWRRNSSWTRSLKRMGRGGRFRKSIWPLTCKHWLWPSESSNIRIFCSFWRLRRDSMPLDSTWSIGRIWTSSADTIRRGGDSRIRLFWRRRYFFFPIFKFLQKSKVKVFFYNFKNVSKVFFKWYF